MAASPAPVVVDTITGPEEVFVIVQAKPTPKVLQVSTQAPDTSDFKDKEFLVFSRDLKTVRLDFNQLAYGHRDGKGVYQCLTNYHRTQANPDYAYRSSYNPCDSHLTRNPQLAKTAGTDAAVDVLLLGTPLLFGVQTYFAVPDNDRILAVIDKLSIMPLVEETRHDTYQARVASANTLQSLKQVQAFYTDYDPDNLMPGVAAKITLLEAEQLAAQQAVTAERQKQEALAAAAHAEEAKQQAAAEAEQERQNALQEQADAKRLAIQRQAEAAKLKKFRQSLASEEETNCGPIIEIKGTLIKVSHPVQNYGDEHWIRRNVIFPPGYGCRFFNGEYLPPGTL